MAALAVLGLVFFLVVRSCGYETGLVVKYGIYFALHVALPGVVLLSAVQGRPVSLLMAIALGVPTGYAVEVASFLALAAVNAKAALPLLPLFWLGAAAILWSRRRSAPLHSDGLRGSPGVTLALALLFLCTVFAAVSQMFAESPLVAGLPQRPIFHDWMFLISRATAIKQHWPLEDPSLAGTALQYHYFMLVHAAAASWVSQLEVTVVLLRLMIVPLGAVLVAQAFLLGQLLSRRAWGGVVAALLTVAASEVSFSSHYGHPMFLGMFIRWLYVSPTFFFGMSFFGALLLAVSMFSGRARVRPRQLAWLALLAAAGTGAKGTVLPVLLLALGIWVPFVWVRSRRFPARLVAIGGALGGAFAAVYFTTMASWGTGEASFEPFRVLQITEFWKTSAGQMAQLLSAWMPAEVAGKLANAACALVVIAGTSGVRLLAIAYFVHPDPRHRHTISPWLAAVFLAACAMGLMLHLDSYGELYLILLIRLPMAVLAAAFLVSGAEHLAGCWRAVRAPPGDRNATAPIRFGAGVRSGVGVLFGGVAAAGLALTLVLQCGLWIARNRTGLDAWLRHSPHQRITDEMLSLLEAMRWIRESTEPNAVLVANAFTAGNLDQGRGIVVDHTTAGVHYYYSAFSGRRLYVEGPTYLLDRRRVQRRMQRAADLFYRGELPEFAVAPASPFYAIIDRTLNDGASIALPADFRVFENARYEIYRLPPDLPGRSERTPLAVLKHE